MKTGIFFDGYHTYKKLNNEDSNFNYGFYDYNKVIAKIVSTINASTKETPECKIAFKGWYQGILDYYQDGQDVKNSNDIDFIKGSYWKLKNERNHHLSLIKAGLEPVYLPIRNSDSKEKGVDVAMSVSAINKAHNLGLKCVILVTNDSDFEPLIHNLRKYGVYTIVISFKLNGQNDSNRLKEVSDLHLTFEDIISDAEINSYLEQKEELSSI